jgi:MFS family permease
MGAYGWRAGQWMWALVTIALCVPAALMVRESPERQGLLPDGVPVDKAGSGASATAAESVRRQADALRGPSMTTRQALRNGVFWRLATSLTLTSLAAGPVLALMVPALTKGGVSREVATFTNSSFPLVLAILRLTMARWGDALERRNLMAACFVSQTVATVALAFTTQDTVFLVAPFLVLYGIGFGIPVPLRSTLTADYFGVNSMGTIQGILQFLTTVGGVAGPLLVGWLVDVTGSYRWPFLVLAVAAFAAIPLMLTLPQIKPRSPVARPQPA